MVDLYELKQLTAFAELGTLSRVAEAFHLSTPSVTRSMQHLETVLRRAPLHPGEKPYRAQRHRPPGRLPRPESSWPRRRMPSSRSGPTTSGSGPSW